MNNSRYISLNNIKKSYKKGRGNVEILKDFNLDIAQGEFVAIMGPSGLGKSTLLHLIGGLDQATSGDITIGERKISQLSESQLTRWRADNVGFVFQAHHLLPVLTAQKNVELPLVLTHLNAKQRQQHANAALSLVDMDKRSSHYPSELSGGQEQRVAIARAIVSDPKLLLCDEPTGNLDDSTGEQIYQLLTTLSVKKKTAFVVVTHDIALANKMDRVLRIKDGNLVDTESSQESAKC